MSGVFELQISYTLGLIYEINSPVYNNLWSYHQT